MGRKMEAVFVTDRKNRKEDAQAVRIPQGYCQSSEI